MTLTCSPCLNVSGGDFIDKQASIDCKGYPRRRVIGLQKEFPYAVVRLGELQRRLNHRGRVESDSFRVGVECLGKRLVSGLLLHDRADAAERDGEFSQAMKLLLNLPKEPGASAMCT
jgi:hypothetical protein